MCSSELTGLIKTARALFSISFISHAYSNAFSLITIPVIFSALGPDRFGVIGFFFAFQIWFTLIDLGLTPLVLRESSRFNVNRKNYKRYSKFLGFSQFAFTGLGTIGCSISIFALLKFSEDKTEWIGFDVTELYTSIVLLVLISGLRWYQGMYRSVISGLEFFNWISLFNITTATLRNTVPVIAVLLHPPNLNFYFVPLLFLTIAETFLLRLKFNNASQFSTKVSPAEFRINLRKFRGLLGPLALSSMGWTLWTQVDKIVLSGILPLEQFGYFTIVNVISAAIFGLSIPIMQIIGPRIIGTFHSSSDGQSRDLYQFAFRLIGAVCLGTAMSIVGLSQEVMFLMTGDVILADEYAFVLAVYCLANGVASLNTIPYQVQLASGRLTHHLTLTLCVLVIQIPMVLITVTSLGVIGAGFSTLIITSAWFLINLLITQRFVKNNGFFKASLSKCILSTLPSAIIALILSEINFVIDYGFGRVACGTLIVIVSIVSVSINLYLPSRLQRSNH